MLNTQNAVVISGRLTADSKLVADGKLLTFSIAVDNSGSDRDNSDQRTGFFDCKIWLTDSQWSAAGFVDSVRKLQESGRLNKGAPVGIVGSLTHDRWSDNEGNKRSSIAINVESITSFAKASGNTSAPADNTSSAPAAAAATGEASYSGAEPF